MRPRSPLTPPAILNTKDDIQNMLTLLARLFPVVWYDNINSEALTTPKTIDNIETFNKFLVACC